MHYPLIGVDADAIHSRTAAMPPLHPSDLIRQRALARCDGRADVRASSSQAEPGARKSRRRQRSNEGINQKKDIREGTGNSAAGIADLAAQLVGTPHWVALVPLCEPLGWPGPICHTPSAVMPRRRHETQPPRAHTIHGRSSGSSRALANAGPWAWIMV